MVENRANWMSGHIFNQEAHVHALNTKRLPASLLYVWQMPTGQLRFSRLIVALRLYVTVVLAIPQSQFL